MLKVSCMFAASNVLTACCASGFLVLHWPATACLDIHVSPAELLLHDLKQEMRSSKPALLA
jgi:hypothetical protein